MCLFVSKWVFQAAQCGLQFLVQPTISDSRCICFMFHHLQFILLIVIFAFFKCMLSVVHLQVFFLMR